MDVQMTKSEAQVQKDPFLMLGYGVNAYFDIMYSLIFMFLTISIACIPMYYSFAYNNKSDAIYNMDIPLFKKLTQ